MGLGVSLHGSNPEPLMSALGPERTLKRVHLMSALPPISDIRTASRYPGSQRLYGGERSGTSWPVRDNSSLGKLGDVRRNPLSLTMGVK
jgi:hypothetical protein